MRSYLSANCAHCHYPGNPANPSAGFDTRLATPLAQQNIVNGSVLYDLGLTNARIIAPQAPASSVMLTRLSINGLHQMPPIGRNTVDHAAVTSLTAWINAIPIEPPPATNRSPVALNDDASTPLNTPITLSVLANDSDPDNDALTVSSPTTPSSGSVAALSGNQYRYTPANGFTGTATFLYTVLDGRGGSATATVTIRILPPATSNSVAFFDGTSRLTAPTSYSGVAMGVADAWTTSCTCKTASSSASNIKAPAVPPSPPKTSVPPPPDANGPSAWAMPTTTATPTSWSVATTTD